MEYSELRTLEYLDALAVVLDLQGAILAWTHRFERATARDPALLRGTPLWDLVAGNDAEALRCVLADVAGDGKSRSIATGLTLRSGEPRTIAWACSAIAGRRDAGRAIVAIGIDIATPRESAAHRVSSTHSQVLMSMAEGVSFTDKDGIIRFTNPALEAMFGYAEGELVGQHVAVLNDASPEDNARLVAEVIAVLASGASWHGEFRNRRKDGSVFYTSAHISTLHLPDGLCWVSVQEDITVRKQAEAALRDADARKGEFLATLSHELRNPLTPIRNALAILDDEPLGSDIARRMRAILDRQVSHLVRIVDDLMDIERISRGQLMLRRERVDLGELVASTTEDHRSGFESCGIALERERERDPDPLFVVGDATRLVQILGNLLGNAMKFTPRGGRTTVSLARAGDYVALRVRDNGVGIERDVLRQLFTPFTQARQPLDRTPGGLGLGLAVTKRLVELHGGSVTAASDGPGTGTELEVRLPLASAAPPDVPAVRPRGVERRRVLVIEDNRDAAETLQYLLESTGHDVRVAHDGVAGLAAGREFLPEIVFCDLGLPGMSGFEVCRELRADPAFARVVLVALSGYTQPGDLERAATAGFTVHVAKPPTRDDLQRAIDAYPRSE